MGKFIDLTGQQFGRWTVIEKGHKGTEWYWLCECSCPAHTRKEVIGSSLRAGRSKSCGCFKEESDRKPKGNVIDLTGMTFSHLTVIQRDGSDTRGEAKWLCECDCPAHTKISVLSSNLRTGHTQSCGCERRSHGELKVAEILTKNNIFFEQEKVMFKFANGHNATFDFFVNNKYLIEYDGETHYQSNAHGWHTLERLKKQQERDAIKNQWCRENNIPLIRIPYTHLNQLCIEDLLLETSQFLI